MIRFIFSRLVQAVPVMFLASVGVLLGVGTQPPMPSWKADPDAFSVVPSVPGGW